jgi:hypothetical protein
MTKKRILGCIRVPPVEYHCSNVLQLLYVSLHKCVHPWRKKQAAMEMDGRFNSNERTLNI